MVLLFGFELERTLGISSLLLGQYMLQLYKASHLSLLEIPLLFL